MSTIFEAFVSLIESAMQLNIMLLDPLANGDTGGAPFPPDPTRGNAAPEPDAGIVMFLNTKPLITP